MIKGNEDIENTDFELQAKKVINSFKNIIICDKTRFFTHKINISSHFVGRLQQNDHLIHFDR